MKSKSAREKDRRARAFERTKKPILSGPYKLINLGANNCLASQPESQIAGVDLAVFRGHAFSLSYANVFTRIGKSKLLPHGNYFIRQLASLPYF